ncbi:CubicO group peptidase, beta-lactamase class C family [Tenacibaculum sp. MAR_2009_124]|uniref:serine hydrolase domain-containing protein n=1 Tax=Tenacibaculum sp. MAR_2009_124 TaxID=1250059 RepID=UPI00089CB798|nr:serine hydrolase domain-containing protein [Tenacibaculum sp. MAR_2009_124]SED22457.1 CubicO group peptidase, beta-lactamase class C family [Tenacibaculum sp. MAR_2009_124]
MKHRSFLLTFSFIGITLFKSYSQDTDFVGYATALIKKDSIIETNYIGYSNKEKSLKYNSSTIQPIGSVSKTVIGLSIMIAKEKGLLDLDEDIRKYLDFEFVNPHSKKENKITLRHLATHTSGIVDNEKSYESSYSIGLEPNMELGVYLKEYLIKGGSKYSKKNFNKSSAGRKYEYSNIASGLAAYIIEKVSGKPFDLFTEENIFKPLKMHNTGWFYKDIEKENHAILYNEQDKALEPYSCAIYPDGSLKTTISDLSIYLKELIKGFNKKSKLLSKKSWEELFKPSFTDKIQIKNINKKEPNTGIFMAHFKSGNIGHTGSDLGVSTIMLFDPKTKTGKIFMANEDLTEKNVEKFKLIWKSIK